MLDLPDGLTLLKDDGKTVDCQRSLMLDFWRYTHQTVVNRSHVVLLSVTA